MPVVAVVQRTLYVMVGSLDPTRRSYKKALQKRREREKAEDEAAERGETLPPLAPGSMALSQEDVLVLDNEDYAWAECTVGVRCAVLLAVCCVLCYVLCVWVCWMWPLCSSTPLLLIPSLDRLGYVWCRVMIWWSRTSSCATRSASPECRTRRSRLTPKTQCQMTAAHSTRIRKRRRSTSFSQVRAFIRLSLFFVCLVCLSLAFALASCSHAMSVWCMCAGHFPAQVEGEEDEETGQQPITHPPMPVRFTSMRNHTPTEIELGKNVWTFFRWEDMSDWDNFDLKDSGVIEALNKPDMDCIYAGAMGFGMCTVSLSFLAMGLV
jgi:hypothetical protein